MLSVKKTVSGIFLIFTFWLTSCGLPPGPNTALTFATINSSTIPLSPSGVNSINPQIAVDSSNRIFVVWQDNLNNISYTYSNDGGTTFQLPVIPVGGGSYPRITTDGNGNVYIIWYSGSTSTFQFNYATNNNVFQNSPITVSTPFIPFPSSQVPQADISFVSGNLFVTWSQCTTNSLTCPIYDVFYSSIPLSRPVTSSTITTSSFSNPINVSNGSSGNFSLYPKIAPSAAGNPYFLFQMTNPSGLYLYKTTSNTQYSVGNPSAASNASLGIDVNGSSYVAWNPQTTGSDVYFNTLPASSNLFKTSLINLSNNGTSYGPTIGIDSSQYVYVAFFSRSSATPNLYDVFLERSSDGGKSFSGAMNISNTSGDSVSYAPGMAIVGKTSYIVWDDNTFSANHQILFQKVTLN